MATGDYKSTVDYFKAKPEEDRFGSLDTDNRLSGLDISQRLIAMDHKRRVYGLDVDNTMVSIPVLSMENFGHSADYVGKPGSILEATNAKVLDQLGVVSATEKMDVVNEDGITVTNRASTASTLHYMHYSQVDSFPDWNQAIAATGGIDSIRLDGTAVGTGGLDLYGKWLLDVPLVIPVAIQKHGTVYRRTIGPFVIPIWNYASTQVEKSYNSIANKCNTGISSKPLTADTSNSYESNIVELWLSGVSNEVFDYITWSMDFVPADWDSVVITTRKKMNRDYSTVTTYTTTFNVVGGVIQRSGDVQIPITWANTLEVSTTYTKGTNVVTEYVFLAGGFDFGSNLTYEYFSTTTPSLTLWNGFDSCYGVWRFGVDISRGNHPNGVKLTCRVWSEAGGTGNKDFTLESYKGGVSIESNYLNIQHYKAMQSMAIADNEAITFDNFSTVDRVNITSKKYYSGDVIDVYMKPVNASIAKVGSDEFYNGTFIGGLVKTRSSTDEIISICNSGYSVTKVSVVRETADFKICTVTTGSGIGIGVYETDRSRIRYATLLTGSSNSLLLVSSTVTVSLINVITESEGYISFVVTFSNDRSYYFEYNTMANTDSAKLFEDSIDTTGRKIWASNSWCYCYELSQYGSTINLEESNSFVTIGDKKYMSIISCNDDIALDSSNTGSMRVLNGHNSIYSVNDLLRRSIGVVNDTVKFAMPSVKIIYPFKYPAITVNMTTDVDPTSSTPTPRDVVTMISGIGSQMPITVHSAVIVSTPAIDTTTREYTLLPNTLNSVTGISNDIMTRPLNMYSVIGRTNVVVGDNLYEPSSFKLMKKNDKPLLPENGNLRIYGGLVIVSNDKTSSIYNQSELGFNYLTSIADTVLSNIVNVSGSLIFAGAKAVYSFVNGGIRKLMQLKSSQVQIKSINGSDFTIVSLEPVGTSSTSVKLLQIEQDSSLSTIETVTTVGSIYNVVDSDNIIYEDVSMFDSSYNAKQITTTTVKGNLKLKSRNISLMGNGKYGFMCDYVMVVGFAKTDTGFTYPTGETDYVDLSLIGLTETTVAQRKKFSVTNGIAERLLFPIGKELREFQVVLTAFPTVRISDIQLVGKFVNSL